MLRLVPLLKGRPGLLLARAESSSPAFEDLDRPVPRTGGRPQFWKEPIYTGPYVNPLHKGPDYSVVGGPRPLATNKAEADRLIKQKELAKKVVQLLGEIKTAEDLYKKQCSAQKALGDESTRWTPNPKGTQEICSTSTNFIIMTEVASIIEQYSKIDNEVERAVKIKDEANKFFKDEKYDIAIELYTKAIELDPQQPTYYGNRSIAYLRRELFGSALNDANEAIRLDPAYVKAYFRRASANMALGKFKLALKDYDAVRKFRPNDADAKKKYEECSKVVKRIAFEKAIACDYSEKKIIDSIRPEDYPVEESYSGPRLEGDISPEFMKDLVAHFKSEKKLHIRYAYKILLAVFNILKVQDSLVHITVPDKKKFTICGDIHGQFYDLCNIFTLNGVPSEENPYLFNGDFVDRGSFSVEVIFTLLGYKLLYPNHLFLARGNHESDTMNKMYGFEGEVKAKYNVKMSEFFTELFNQLPLVHVINRKIFCCHGGLFPDENVTLEQIARVNRVRQPPEDGPMCGLLWSDPQEEKGIGLSKRGAGIQWGPDISKKFLEQNDLMYIVRSHEVKPQGYEKHHDGLVWTIFSAPNYCDQIGNLGAFITITGDNLYPPKITTFEAVPHPPAKPMMYGSSFLNFLS